MRIYSHMCTPIQVLLRSSHLPSCFRNDSLLWLNSFSFTIAWLKQQRKQTLMHKASPLTHLSCRGSDGALFFSFMPVLFCSNSRFDVFFPVHLSPRTMGRSSERPYCVCHIIMFEVPSCSRVWGRGATSTAPTHGAQTKQQDECFLNPTWQGGTPICPFGLADWLSESTEENIRQVIGEVHERTQERSSQCSLSNFPPLNDNSSWLHLGSYFHTLRFHCNSRGCSLS